MASIKLAYLGGGSSRAAGTMASFIHHGAEFEGSEVVLIDQRPDELEVVRTLAEKMARNEGVDLKVTATTDQRAGLEASTRCSRAFAPATSRCGCRTSSSPCGTGSSGRRPRARAAS